MLMLVPEYYDIDEPVSIPYR